MIRHGVKKNEKPKISEEVKEIEKVIDMGESPEKHYQMVLLNPDDYNSWNYLKNLIFTSDDSIEEIKKQLEISQKAIQANPKSYATWFHRYFLFSRWSDMWFKEHQLCALLLKFDSRNFHCWNYCLKNKFKIKEDLHNYTSMHYLPYKQRNLFIDPSDEGIWCTFEKRRSQEISNYTGILKKHDSFSEIIFDNIFSGTLEVNDDIILQSVPTKRIILNGNVSEIKINGKKCSVVFEEIPRVLDEILALDPCCIHALRRKMIYTMDKYRSEISLKLQKIDPLRQKYYKWLEKREYKIFLLILE